MTMRTNTLLLAASITLGATATLHAQEGAACDVKAGFDACYEKKLAAAQLAFTATAADDATSKKATGSAAASASGTTTAVKDFLPQLASAFSIPGFGGPGKGLDLEVNKKLPWASVKLQAVSQEPVLFDALVQNIPKQLRAPVKDSIDKTLGDLDNVKLSLLVNAEGTRFGRWTSNSTVWLSKVVADAQKGLATKSTAADEALQRFIGSISPVAVAPAATCGREVRPDNRPLSCYSDEDQRRIAALLDSLVSAESAADPLRHKALVNAGLDRLDELVNNQDQLILKGEFNAVQRRIGPKTLSASLRWEHGFANLSQAQSAVSGAGNQALQLHDYVRDHSGVLDREPRAWFEADFSQTLAYDFALPADSARVVLPGSLTFEPTVGIGQYFGSSAQRVRADAGVKYRFSDEQSVRANRWAGTLVLTQKLSDQSTAVLSFIWADHEDFVGTVDKKVRANIGVSYKLSKPGS